MVFDHLFFAQKSVVKEKPEQAEVSGIQFEIDF